MSLIIENKDKINKAEQESKLTICWRIQNWYEKTFDPKDVYVNSHPIDTYIDQYWLVNCPTSFNNYQVNQVVY